MTTIAILELHSWSEIAALVGVISAVYSVLTALFVMWLNTKYVGKPHFYATKNEADAMVEAIDKRVASIEQIQALSNAPMVAVQVSVNAMQAQLRELTDAVGKMKDSVSQGLHDIDKRVAVIESATLKPRGGRGGGGGR